MITVNSWECGKGKSTKWIKKLILGSEYILLVVPSINLQYQYAETFNNIRVVNNKNTDDGRVISEIYHLLNQKTKFICITTQAFILLTLTVSIKRDYTLIIDEAFDPVRRFELDGSDAKLMPDFKFRKRLTIEGHISYVMTDYTSKERSKVKDWAKITVDIDKDVPMLRDSKRWQMLMDENYNTYMRVCEYEKLCINSKDRYTIVQMLSKEVISNWNGVYIAAARFKTTFMYNWLKSHKLNINETHTFTPHNTHITLHAPADIKWSISLNNKDEGVLKQYSDYINNNTIGNVLSIRNKKALNLLAYDVNVKHNVHGMNDKDHICNVSLETALNPCNNLRSFYKLFLDMNEEQIKDAFCAYLFYQVIMRTAIRKNKEINVFLLDTMTYALLLDYFSNITVEEIPINVRNNKKSPGRPKKAITKSRKEINADAYKKRTGNYH